MKTRKWMHTCLSLILLLHLYACATPKAVNYAEELSSRPVSYHQIVYVNPIALHDNNRIKISVQLSCLPKDCPDLFHLISLPSSILESDRINPDKLKFEKFSGLVNPYLPIYWFPINKSVQSANDLIITKYSRKSTIDIETLHVPLEDWINLNTGLARNTEDIYSLLRKNSKIDSTNGSIYAVQLLDPDTVFREDLFLIFCPEIGSAGKSCFAGIVGGYLDSSTKAGYATVPLAMVADVILGILIAVGSIVVLAFAVVLS